ncbi:DEHA2D08382p [Debaryomyces hansenii CBS767]|uniref:DEHA2D08382p n=1 Tax=Debaryomyces hansenii (strain ATCC 36239 / CBS 767 / BCRC 21394 / JCM 1990 / NBRC 0083 / IGC 2968) TaxID=284592 RepID=Q6BSJ5_DEBHA|nr:DEHA2D08382p [Debaryomyces hansenii CBS767]CAG86971.2 DEHA2D08382p [Debaryomyces hansenii CBS767]|eukprot:XP_458825.2 DEHA2D08382p [Debaryomyces hansenii CBS767]
MYNLLERHFTFVIKLNHDLDNVLEDYQISKIAIFIGSGGHVFRDVEAGLFYRGDNKLQSTWNQSVYSLRLLR